MMLIVLQLAVSLRILGRSRERSLDVSRPERSRRGSSDSGPFLTYSVVFLRVVFIYIYVFISLMNFTP